MTVINRALSRAVKHLAQPTASSGPGAWRVFFGLLVVLFALRYIGYGWIDKYFTHTAFHFKYSLFTSLPFLQEQTQLYCLFWSMAACGLLIAAGRFYRAAAVVYCLLFGWFFLADVAIYLNHYYLLWCLSFLMIFMPGRHGITRRIHLYSLRAMAGCVYFYGAMAKLNTEWLLHGRPLDTWLFSRNSLLWGLAGSLDVASLNDLAVGMSLAGFVFDLLIFWALLLRRSRLYAWPVLVVFHLLTRLLFDIGLFPVIMIALSTVFFEPDWPDRLAARFQPFIQRAGLFKRTPGRRPAAGRPVVNRVSSHLNPVVFSILVLFTAVQWTVPAFRHLAADNDAWNERYFRFAWKIMAIDKKGYGRIYVYTSDAGPPRRISPAEHLTRLQQAMMWTQPDLILQYADYLASLYCPAFPDAGRCRVSADVFVSLNGRPARRFISARHNLLQVDRSGLSWLEPFTADQVKLHGL